MSMKHSKRNPMTEKIEVDETYVVGERKQSVEIKEKRKL
jgi:hypothetical protein